MADLELPKGEQIPLRLELRTVRGRPAPAAPFLLDGRIAVGEPQIRLLTPADAGPDAELANFIESESPTWNYYLVALSCTFVSDNGQPQLATAWLRLTLTGQGDAGDPIAYSMDPLVLDEIRPLPYTIKLTVRCVISSEFSLQGERGKRQIAVQALYEGTSKPAWTFSRTPAKPLHGVQRLRLVVRAPASQLATGRIDVGATIRHRRLGTNALSYAMPVADIPESLHIVFRH